MYMLSDGENKSFGRERMEWPIFDREEPGRVRKKME